MPFFASEIAKQFNGGLGQPLNQPLLVTVHSLLRPARAASPDGLLDILANLAYLANL